MTRRLRASLRTAHRKNCPSGQATSLDSLTGCTCTPSYYVLWRTPSGEPRKSRRFDDRGDGERELTAVQAQLDQGGRVFEQRKSISFREWVKVWTGSYRGRESTRR